jgi:pimeloyl-ACP methyl ester carboxylesterase
MLLPVHQPTSFVEAGGHRLEHVDIPPQIPNRPELLLLHEGLGSVSMWRGFPADLAARTGCRTIAYSRAGFGRSSPRTRPVTPRFMHDEAFEVLPDFRERLAIRNPVLVGHSTGASMALIHAGVAPSGTESNIRGRVAGVVAIAPFAFVEDSNLESIRAARDRYAHVRDRLARHHDNVDDVFHGWSDLWLDPAFADWSIDADLAAIRCPILAILGEGDEYCTSAQLDRLATAAPHAKVQRMLLADCGHSPHRDQPQVVLAAIDRFIESLEA